MARTVGSSLKDGKEPVNPTTEEFIEREAEVTQGMFLQAVRELVAKKGELKRTQDEYKALRKTWKDRHLSLKQLDESVRKTEWSREEVREFADRQARYDGWLGLPVAGQGDLFAGLSADEVQKKEWFNLGFTAGGLGLPAKAPDTCPPEYLQSWLAGHAEADEQIWTNDESIEAQNEAAAEIDPKAPDNVAQIGEAIRKKRAAKAKAADAEPTDPQDGVKATGEVIH